MQRRSKQRSRSPSLTASSSSSSSSSSSEDERSDKQPKRQTRFPHVPPPVFSGKAGDVIADAKAKHRTGKCALE
jgi:hypothetical protein